MLVSTTLHEDFLDIGHGTSFWRLSLLPYILVGLPSHPTGTGHCSQMALLRWRSTLPMVISSLAPPNSPNMWRSQQTKDPCPQKEWNVLRCELSCAVSNVDSAMPIALWHIYLPFLWQPVPMIPTSFPLHHWNKNNQNIFIYSVVDELAVNMCR